MILLALPVAITLITAVALTSDLTSAPAASDTQTTQGTTTFRTVGDGEFPNHRPPLGATRDPLSAKEIGYAIHLATTDPSIPSDATDVRGSAGSEVLFTELPAEIKETTRRAVVHLYDYRANTAYEQTVDLTTGTVRSERHRRLQPPISATEASAAVQLAIDHSPHLLFSREFEKSQAVPLVSAEQVTYVAGTFVHDGSTRTGQACGIDRCAQLMVQLPSGAYLSTWGFVVDLSTRTVIEIN